MDSGTMPLFGFDDEPPRPAARLGESLRELAAKGVYFGTSSWKYEGWIGQIYSRDRYLTRGKFSQKKFEAECLKEYAQTFPVVCGDFSFYQFPTAAYWANLFGESPRSLRFAFKVPEEITVATWPKHARYGARGGQQNEHFLDAALFERAFTRELLPYKDRVTTLIFEFGTFSHKTFKKVTDYFERLDPFLAALPGEFRYGVEIRNEEYLLPQYFSTLASHKVAHVFNSWSRMPTLSEQISLSEAFTTDFTVVRALLQQGVAYEQAVKRYQPYTRVLVPDPATRGAMRRLVDRAIARREPLYAFVNNRLEGNAPETIEAVVAAGDA